MGPSVDDIAWVKARLRDAAGRSSSRGQAGGAPVTSIAKVESDRGRKNSRVKGSRAELDVAELFSRWCGELVRRTPQSGGWSNAKFGVTADLVCANKAFPYHVEIKHREGWVLDDLVTGVRRDHDKSIVQWWRQCVESCPKARLPGRGREVFEKEPLLVFRRNRQPWLVMTGQRFFSPLAVEQVFARFLLPLGTPLRDVLVLKLDEFLALARAPAGLKGPGGSP